MLAACAVVNACAYDRSAESDWQVGHRGLKINGIAAKAPPQGSAFPQRTRSLVGGALAAMLLAVSAYLRSRILLTMAVVELFSTNPSTRTSPP
ncbi:hypothetical protein ACVW0Y_000684 [Pseudomonas sp. TE3786]